MFPGYLRPGEGVHLPVPNATPCSDLICFVRALEECRTWLQYWHLMSSGFLWVCRWQFSLSFLWNLLEHWKQENFLSSEWDFRWRAKFFFGTNFPQVLQSSLSILKLHNDLMYGMRLVKSMCSSVLNWNFTNVIKIIQMLYKIIFPALKWCRHMTDVMYKINL